MAGTAFDGPLPGDGQKGHTWQSVHAKDFVAALASRPKLTYELGDGRTWAVAAKGTAEAIKPFLGRCPLAPSRRAAAMAVTMSSQLWPLAHRM